MVLRIKIDGKWTAREMSKFFSELEAIAQFAETGNLPDNIEPPMVEGTKVYSGSPPKPSWISIRRIKYGSKGFTDLLGLASCLEQIRLMVEFFVKHYAMKNDQYLKDEKSSTELIAMRLDVVERARELGLDYEEIIGSGWADELMLAAQERRITDVEEIKKDE